VHHWRVVYPNNVHSEFVEDLVEAFLEPRTLFSLPSTYRCSFSLPTATQRRHRVEMSGSLHWAADGKYDTLTALQPKRAPLHMLTLIGSYLFLLYRNRLANCRGSICHFNDTAEYIFYIRMLQNITRWNHNQQMKQTHSTQNAAQQKSS
jgi:hypothetical protein